MEGELLPLAIRILHAIIWKLFLIEFYLTGSEYGHTFNIKHTFTFAARRLQVRMNAKVYAHREAVRVANIKNRTPPKDDNINKLLFPFVEVTGLSYKWSKFWLDKCRELRIPINDG